jgi:hypothetical protein
MGRKSIIAIIILTIFIIVFGILLVIKAVQSNSKRKAVKENVTTAIANNTTAVSSIVYDPLVYKDLTVNVNGQIVDWTTKNAFSISSGNNNAFSTGTNARLIAVSEQPFPQFATGNNVKLGEETKVDIIGTVRIVDKEQLEVLLGYDFDTPEFAISNSGLQSWTLGPVLIVNKIVKL